MWLLVLVMFWGPFVILRLKPYVTPCLSHSWGPFVILGLKPYVTLVWVMSWGPFVILGLKPYVWVTSWGPSMIPSVSLGLKPYVTPCLSRPRDLLWFKIFVLVWNLMCFLFESCPGTFCDSWVKTLCDSLFESCPRGSSVIRCESLGLKPSVIVWEQKCKDQVYLARTIVRKRQKIDQRNEEMSRSVLYPEFLMTFRMWH